MEIVYLPSAVRDFAWFNHYYEVVFPAGNEKARRRFAVVEQLLSENPYLGERSESHDGIHEMHILRTPFTLIYRVTKVRIEVLRLWDNRQGGTF